LDIVFKALADSSRRAILDSLFRQDGQTLTELCAVADFSRQGLSKHLKILEKAGLVVTEWAGREKRHYLNPVPVQEIGERWIGKFARRRAGALIALRDALEEKNDG
jgi:DNA-binding transcriptional ArsR family regulator